MNKITTFDTKADFWAEALSIYDEAKAGSSNFRIAMSGGSAAQLFDQDLDLSETSVYQVDERFVPSDHPDSNARLLDAKLEVAKMQGRELKKYYFPILETREDSLEAYAKNLAIDEDDYLFDLTVLGVGPDGHTASLFPHHPALDDEGLLILSETDAFAVPERLSLGFEALRRSRFILILMMGEGKADIIKTIEQPGAFHDCPARKVCSWPQTQVLWCRA